MGRSLLAGIPGSRALAPGGVRDATRSEQRFSARRPAVCAGGGNQLARDPGGGHRAGRGGDARRDHPAPDRRWPPPGWARPPRSTTPVPQDHPGRRFAVRRATARFDGTIVGGGPVCVKAWKAGDDNGGATSQGVTKDKVTVVAVLPNDEQLEVRPGHAEAQGRQVREHLRERGPRLRAPADEVLRDLGPRRRDQVPHVVGRATRPRSAPTSSRSRP